MLRHYARTTRSLKLHNLKSFADFMQKDVVFCHIFRSDAMAA